MRAYFIAVTGLWVAAIVGASMAFDQSPEFWAKVLGKFPNLAVAAACAGVAAMTFTVRGNLIAKVQSGLETPSYKLLFQAWRESHPEATLFAPVKNLEAGFNFVMLQHIASAGMNLFLWNIHRPWITALCVVSVAMALVVFAGLSLQLHLAIQDAHRRIEQEKQRELEVAARPPEVHLIGPKR